MKNVLFSCCIFLLFCTACNNEENNAFNQKTLDEGMVVLQHESDILQMRIIKGGVWNGFFAEPLLKRNSLTECLENFEYFYHKVKSTPVELSDSEEFFYEDLEYIERQEMPCPCGKKFPELSSNNEEELQLIRLAKTLQNIRKENYYRDIFLLNSVEGQDTTETIAAIKSIAQSYILLSCEASALMKQTDAMSFSDSLTNWITHCKKTLHADQKNTFQTYADSLGYAEINDFNYSTPKLLSDIQLLDLETRKLLYSRFTFNIELNPRINLKLLQKE